MTDTFQSNGLCHDHCLANYAFAIVQGSKCWCSNFVPSTEATGCTQECPGYGLEQCGNTSKGLFGYIALTNAPSGTSGPSSTVRTTSNPPQTSSSSSSSPIDTTSASIPISISTVVEQGPTKTLIIVWLFPFLFWLIIPRRCHVGMDKIALRYFRFSSISMILI